MTRFAVDTSCMVAAVCSWHEHHESAVGALDRRLRRGERLTVAAHALAEAYAVLTRLPAPHRLSPADAWTLVEANFVDDADVIAMSGDAQVKLLSRLAAGGIGGGRTYDALIGECARQGKAAVLLTFNPRHFEPAPDGLTIEEPSLGAAPRR
jgi:predicted nucleic acid-binding protein